MAETGTTSEQQKTPQTPVEKPKETAAGRIDQYFANGNNLITLQGSSLVIDDDTRRLLALFEDGQFLVSENHKFDGRVLSFEVLARKRKLPINKPKYISINELNTVYAIAERRAANLDMGNDNLENIQMQKDFVNVVARAAQQKVSDVHIVVANSTQIFFRANGTMVLEMEYNKDWGEAFVRAAFASADISDSNYAQNEFQAAQKLGSTPLRGSKGKLMLPHNVLAIRLQFNPIAFGSQYLVMRLLYADDNPDGSGDLESLGFGQYELDLFYRLRAIPIGLNIIAGPTGSGKSTTLQRNMIRLLQDKKYECNLITVEDPPEYPIPGARQMPVTNANNEEEKDEQFNKALSAALRSDPDIMMVGEIRSLAAAELTFKGALSGHSMWSTLHANSAPAIITRLRDMGVKPYVLNDPEIIKGLISQRLFRTLCPHCRIPVKERMEELSVKRLKKSLGDFGIENTYVKGPGCKFCGGKGVKGRTCVPEIIMPDSTFLELLISGETRKAIEYWTNDLNGRTLKEAAIERMLKGLIDLDEIERWCGLLDQRPIY
ncbi:MAG: Flp pilus assembly complex ATPase component TadA [Lactobacillaceae bacterium]|jgi:type II secretory ATPase GspE/PulE/Tfp pilus assembly ATPase PilB-like protein|nr:Flp pilus assembly complex ATPase component TadA [Lactobacillaceae bacterium]